MNQKRSQPALEFQIRLMTRQAQSMNNWLTKRLGGMFFMLEVVFSENESMHDSVMEAIDRITKELQQLETSLQNYLSEQPEIPSSKARISYSAPKDIVINCTTPQARCCVSLLKNYDQLVQYCDRQWLLGSCNREQSRKTIWDWTATISHKINDCSEHYRQLREQMLQNQHLTKDPSDDSQEKVANLA